MKLTVIFSIIVLSSVSLASSIGAENLDHVKKFKQTKPRMRFKRCRFEWIKSKTR